MNRLQTRGIALLALLAMLAFAHAAPKQRSDRERLIGAWHLVQIDSPGADGKTAAGPRPDGMLVYTRDGHVSVQLMYPEAPPVPDNAYVHGNYEASFGSYEVDEARYTVTHHVLAANTRGALVGKDMVRVYEFTADGKLMIRPVDPGEHWRVIWEHY